jgi:hypothetical protein
MHLKDGIYFNLDELNIFGDEFFINGKLIYKKYFMKFKI